VISRIEEAGAAFVSERVQTSILRIRKNDAHAISVALDKIDPANVDGIAIMAPATPQVRDAISRLTRADL